MQISQDQLNLRQSLEYLGFESKQGIVFKLNDYCELDILFKKIKDEFPYLWLFSLSLNKDVLSYVFVEMECHDKIVIEVNLVDKAVPSIQNIFRNAITYENCISKEGVSFKGHLAKVDFYDEEKELGEVRFVKSIYNPMVGHTQKIKFKMIDDLVSGVRFESGQFHMGFEKVLRDESFHSVLRYTENYFHQKAPLWSFLLCHGAEQGTGIEVTDRAKALRMILLELTRINDHLFFFLNLSKQFHCEALYSACLVWIKRVRALFLSFSGNEYASSVIVYGGVVKDVSQIWLTRALSELIWIEDSIKKVDINLSSQASFRDEFSFRLFSKNLAAQWGVSGPVARAIGINIDYRKMDPIYFYGDIDFDIPLGALGTGYDLIRVRFEEIYQSIKIIIQVVDNLPTGKCLSLPTEDFLILKEAQEEPDIDYYKESVQINKIKNSFSENTFFEGGEGIYHLSLTSGVDTISHVTFSSPQTCFKDFFEKTCKGNGFDRVFSLWSILNINLKEVEK